MFIVFISRVIRQLFGKSFLLGAGSDDDMKFIISQFTLRTKHPSPEAGAVEDIYFNTFYIAHNIHIHPGPESSL